MSLKPDEMDLSFITAEYLSQFDGLMMFTNGNLPMSDEQKQAIVNFVGNGGGFVVHTCSRSDLLRLCSVWRNAWWLFSGEQWHRITSWYSTLRITRIPPTRMFRTKLARSRRVLPVWQRVWDADRPDENVDELFGLPIPVAFSRDRVNVLLSHQHRAY